MDTLKGVTVRAFIIADEFSKTDDGVYYWGALGNMGWMGRFSAHRDLIDQSIIDTVEGGDNVEVVVIGTCQAVAAARGAVLKLKATQPITLAPSSNGSRAKADSSASA